MEYIDVAWLHDNTYDAIRLMSELDADRNEIRKLEFFPDGTVGFAGNGFSTESTGLSQVPIPTLAEINADPQFFGKSITHEVFEAMWAERHFSWNRAV